MGAEEQEKKAKKIETYVAEIVRHQGPIVLPEGMSTETAIEVLQRKAVYDNEDVMLAETVPCFPWDGALALAKALEEQFGFALQQAEWTFFGKRPPAKISIEIAPGQTAQVPWGSFSLPGINGKVSTGIVQLDGRAVFQVVAEVKHANEGQIKALFQRVRAIAMAESIYRGKAISISFNDPETGRRSIPQITFPRISDATVILNRALEQSIEVNLLTPIRYTEATRKAGIPLKRGALLAGVYGTGKTLTANMVAREATQHGWTFIYVTEAGELAEALRFAQQFQPAVVFAEDIDATVSGHERTDEINELLNTLDGIGSKSDETITIMTSNHPESITPAMRRPGRIDLVLEVAPPDAEAATRLLHHYGRGMLAPGQDLNECGELLKGQIPAVIREVVERAKLGAIARTGVEGSELTASDIKTSAETLKIEQALFRPKEPEAPMALRVAEALGDKIGGALHVAMLEAGVK